MNAILQGPNFRVGFLAENSWFDSGYNQSGLLAGGSTPVCLRLFVGQGDTISYICLKILVYSFSSISNSKIRLEIQT